MDKAILAQSKLREQVDEVPVALKEIGGCLATVKLEMLEAEKGGGSGLFLINANAWLPKAQKF